MVVKAKNSLSSAKSKESETRLGQKFGIMGDELEYTLIPPGKSVVKATENEDDIMSLLQKIYDLVEAEPGLGRELKDKIARLLAKFHYQEEPGFTAEEAYKSIVRDYQMVRDIPERSVSKPRKNERRTSNRRAPVSPGLVPPSLTNQSSTSKVPTIEEVLAGRPFSPRDFMVSTPPQNLRRQLPRQQSRGNMPAVMPTARPRGGRPPMRGMMPRMGFGMGFRFMGFPMGPNRLGRGFYGHPW